MHAKNRFQDLFDFGDGQKPTMKGRAQSYRRFGIDFLYWTVVNWAKVYVTF